MTRRPFLILAALLAGCAPGYVRDARDLNLRVGLVREPGAWPGGADPVALFNWYDGDASAKFASVVVRSSMGKVDGCDLMIRIVCQGTDPTSPMLFHVHSAYTGELIETLETTFEEQIRPGPGGMALRVLSAFREGSPHHSRISSQRAACPPAHLREPATAALRLNEVLWQFRPRTIEEDSGKEMIGWHVAVDAKTPGYYAILRRGATITRIQQFPGGRTVALVAKQAPVAELFWQAMRSLQWEARGDALAAKKGAALEDRVGAAAAWERGWTPDAPNPALPIKLSRVYGELIRLPDGPPGLAPYAASAMLRLPSRIDGTPAERQDFALARSCALFTARCWPRLAESLKDAGKGPDADGLRAAIKLLGVETFEPVPEPAFTDDQFALSTWSCKSAPGDDGLPRIDRCVVAESTDRIACFTLSRQSLAGKTRYFLHAGRAEGEEVVESFGEQEPTLRMLQDRIALELARWKAKPSPAPNPPVLSLAGGKAVGNVVLHWSKDWAGATFELRSTDLVAAAWIPGKPGLIKWLGLPAGNYEGRFRSADGNIAETHLLSVGPDADNAFLLDAYVGRPR
jgi:hypothetical protein